MGYIEQTLRTNEQIIRRCQLHWIIYGQVIFLLTIILGLYALLLFGNQTPESKELLLIGSFILIALALLKTAAILIEVLTTEIAVTNQRVIVKTGLIRRHTTEMNLGRIESVDVDQSVLGRLLDYGTVTVRGTGIGTNPLRYIAAPLALRNAI